MNAPHAAVKRARDAREGFVSLPCGAVHGDFNGKGTVFRKVIGDPQSDQGPIGEEGDEKAALFSFGINIEKIFPRENFAAGIQNPEAAETDEFVKKADVFSKRHFLPTGMGIVHGEIVVAVLALQRTAVSHLDRHLGRDAAPFLALVDQGGEFSISGRLQHVSTFSIKAKTNCALGMADSPMRNARAALSNELNQLFLQQRIKKCADVVLCLRRGDLELIAHAIHHLGDGVFLLHEIPENQANLIQGIEGI